MDALHRRLQDLLAKTFDPTPRLRTVRPLRGQASARAYYRARLDAHPNAPGSLIAMVLPEDAARSEEAAGTEATGELPFLQVQRMLAHRGVPVPRIYAADVSATPGGARPEQDRIHGILLLEDLGDETLGARFARTAPSQQPELYTRAVRLLAGMHDACSTPEPGCIAFERRFERSLLRWELDHFLQWGLEAVHGPLSDQSRRELERDFDTLADEIAALTCGFVHRDFQSSNLMLRPNDDALVVLDFQDALRGPYCYDLVALLCDSYVDVPLQLQEALLERYAVEMGHVDTRRLQHDFWLIAAQRKLKDAGRFVYIDRRRGNPDFLRWVPPSLVHVGRALSRLPRYSRLHGNLQRLMPGYPDAVPVPASQSSDTSE